MQQQLLEALRKENADLKKDIQSLKHKSEGGQCDRPPRKRGKFEMECVLPTFLWEKYHCIARSANLSLAYTSEVWKIYMYLVMGFKFSCCNIGNVGRRDRDSEERSRVMTMSHLKKMTLHLDMLNEAKSLFNPKYLKC